MPEYDINEARKDVVWYEWLYQVSNLGRIKSFIKGRLLKSNVVKNWYRSVTLCNWTTRKLIYAHRLIAKTFLPNPDKKPCINHKNGIRNDNRVENLERVTSSENSVHGRRTLWRECHWSWKKWKLCTNSKKIKQYSKQGEFIKLWHSIADVKRQFGYSIWNISSCCRGVRNNANWFIRKFDI